MGIRLGGYFIETNFSIFDVLGSALLAGLWFLAIFAFRMGLAFLELLPELGSLPPDFQYSPLLELLTFSPGLTSVAVAVVLGPVTHAVISRAAIVRVYAELESLQDEDQEGPPGESKEER